MSDVNGRELSSLPPLARLSRALFTALARGESAELTLADLDDEFAERIAAADSPRAAGRAYRRQLIRSLVPAMRDARADRRRRAARFGIGASLDRDRAHALREALQDARYAVRSFASSPGPTAVVLVTLALGIGANTAVFSVVNGVLLRPLPYPDPDRLVVLATRDTQDGDTYTVSPLNFVDWSEMNETLEATYAWTSTILTITDGDRREQVEAGDVSPGFLDVLGVTPILGRGFLPDELGPGSPAVALLSHGFWERRYGADPGVPGSVIELDGRPYEIIGVAPPGLEMPLARTEKDLWVTPRDDWAAEARDQVYLSALGRLKPNVSLARAQEDLSAVHARLRAAYPNETIDTGVAVVPLKSEAVGDVRLALVVVLGAVAFLLLLACANVANLFLARAAGRGTELGVRTALGAGRGRLTRQLLTESTVVALVAGALGVVVGWGGLRLLIALAPDDLPRVASATLDPTVLAFSTLATIVTGVLFGAVPALYATRRDPVRMLRGTGRGQVGGHGLRRLREGLVVAEIASAVVLVVGAGLLARSFGAMLSVDPGFDESNLVLAEIHVPQDRYPEREQRAEFYRGLMEALEASPAVVAAGGAWNAPMNGAVANTGLQLEGEPRPEPGQAPLAEFRIATGGYFDALRIPVLAGRSFLPSDTRDQPRRVVVSRLLAEEMWPGENPVGRRVSLNILETDGAPLWHEVVGVVGDVRLNGLDDPERGVIYLAYSQLAQPWITVTARTLGDPAENAAAVRDAILAFEPLVPNPEITTMSGRVAETLAARRFYLTLLGAFAAIALVLASVGTYGVLAYAVSSRTNEIGVRVAFGASRRRILGQVLIEGMRVAGLGVAIGLLGAWLLSRTLRSLVYGVSVGDPVTYVGVAVLLVVAALLACVVPASRAASVEPLDALRYE
ncbi:MAG: ABC transporter permease [Gemmatimonadota bacterium]|nr:ABC transporter permease [Gemmatimonadota bacterium]